MTSTYWLIISEETLEAMHVIARMDGVSMDDVLNRLVKQEVQRRLEDLKRIAPPAPAISCDDELERELQGIRDDLDKSQRG